uniref:Minor capsid protein L2 n=1 Tax=Phocoena spinipinnis papillomavirus TaxID=82676 RepID=A0A2L1DGF8_PSPV|nr:L2 protein [Omikronpapillomavirus 1]
MVRAKRTRRAAEGDLYAGCRAGQDCPDDIKRKFEQDTWADRFLKWFSSFIYLGNLGIGTGRGSGGSTGYVPLGGRGGARPGMGAQPSRPNIIVDNLGPTEIPVGGPVDAATPSVIVPSESTVVVEGTSTPHDEIPLVPLHPDVPPVTADHSVLDPYLHILPPPDSGGPAILDVSLDVAPINPHTGQPSFPSTSQEVLFPTVTLQPLDVSLLNVESSFAPDTLVNPHGGFEEIELHDFSGPQSPQLTSTPKTTSENGLQTIRGPYNRRTNVLRRFYHRLTQQVKVSKSEFLQNPSKLVTYDFENAAFQPDTTLEFSQPSEGFVKAPDIDFQDVGILHKPIYSVEGSHVRVSRFGVRQTIRTRVGTTIGAKVHFFTDISTISNVSESFPFSTNLGPDAIDPGIELQLFGEATGDTSITDAQNGGIVLQNGGLHDAEHSTSVINGSLHSEFSDSMLLDNYSDTFSNGHLSLMNSSKSRTIISTPQPAQPFRSFPESFGDLSVHYPVSTNNANEPSDAFVINVPSPPLIILLPPGTGPSFLLHPSLLKRKRKRVFY